MKPAMPPRSERDNAAAREHGLALNAAALARLDARRQSQDETAVSRARVLAVDELGDWLQVEP